MAVIGSETTDFAFRMAGVMYLREREEVSVTQAPLGSACENRGRLLARTSPRTFSGNFRVEWCFHCTNQCLCAYNSLRKKVADIGKLCKLSTGTRF